MRAIAKKWGFLGYTLALIAITAVVIGISGIATTMWWGWYVLVTGGVLMLASSALMALVSVSRERSRYRDRAQRDPLMETVSDEEEWEYVERYRDQTPSRPYGSAGRV